MKFRIIKILFFIGFYICPLLFPLNLYSFYKYQNNPIIKINPTQWNSFVSWAPSVILDRTKYLMYYGGFDNAHSAIGLATSNNAVDWFNHISNPIIYWDIITPAYEGVSHASVVKNNNKINPYQIWFNKSEPGENFSLYFSDSFDGITWNIPTKIIFDKPETTWDQNSKSAPTVIYDEINNKYYMWFNARGWLNNIYSWRFGYAVSNDGINWIKNSLPISIYNSDGHTLIQYGIGNPSVIKHQNNYIMFYHSDNGIEQAESIDGLYWIKNNINPVIQKGDNTQDFDINGVSDPNAIIINNIIYLFYSGKNLSNNWQIGLATSIPITPPPSITITPTPTNTSTPSPTPKNIPTVTPTAHIPSNTPTATFSPTATLSPTVTQIQTPSPTPMINSEEPVIFLPGMGGSWNPKEMFLCDLTHDETWYLAPYASVYNKLLDTLKNKAGYVTNKNLFIYGYDWRKNLDWQADKFSDYLNSVLSGKPDGTRTILIGHSMGGLVIRSYLTKYGSSKVSSVLTIASPHLGSTLVYPIWEKGEVENNDLTTKIALNQLISHCKKVFDSQGKTKSRMETVRRFSPSFKDILPVFDFIKRSGTPVNYNTLYQKNSWMINNPLPPDLFGINFQTLLGKGVYTIRYFDVVNPSEKEIRNGEWEDGKPLSFEKIPDGDGTVLLFSGRTENGINSEINADHGSILGNKEGINIILKFLGRDKILLTDSIPPVNALTISLGIPSEISITNPVGAEFYSKDWIVSIFDPPYGRYVIRINPLSSGNAYLRIAEDSIYQVSTENISMLNFKKNNPVSYYFNYSSGSISNLSAK